MPKKVKVPPQEPELDSEPNGYYVHIHTTTMWRRNGGQDISVKTTKIPMTDAFAATILFARNLDLIPSKLRPRVMEEWVKNGNIKHPDGPRPFASGTIDRPDARMVSVHEYSYEPFSDDDRDLFRKAVGVFAEDEAAEEERSEHAWEEE